MNVVKDLPETTAAMVQVARTETSQDVMRAQGKDDYSGPFDRIMDAFDTFIREHSKRTKTAGNREKYDFSNPRDFTIYLLWQIRHFRRHSGGVVSEKLDAKARYEDQFKSAIESGIMPIIDLPAILTPGYEIAFDFQDYKEIKTAIFDYIAERIPKSDLEILRSRSDISNIETKGVVIEIEIENLGVLQIDLVDLYNHGIELDPEQGLVSEKAFSVFPSKNKIMILSTGETIPFRIIPSVSKKDKKGKKRKT